MPAPIVSFVGRSNSGKTTLIEAIIPLLKRTGLRVGAIKHNAHRFEIDHPGKDSWRFTHAGADTMVITSAGQMAMVKVLERQKTVQEIADELFGDVDIVIVEGYKAADLPKIEVVRFDAPVIPADQLLAWVDNRAAGPVGREGQDEQGQAGQAGPIRQNGQGPDGQAGQANMAQAGSGVVMPEAYSQVERFQFEEKERIAEWIITDIIRAGR